MTVRELIDFLRQLEQAGQGSKNVQVVVDLKPNESHMIIGHVICALQTDAAPDSVVLVTQGQAEDVARMSTEYQKVN